MSNKPTVGVIGLGSMGMGTALVLAERGFAPRGADVRPDAVATLAAAGGTGCASPAELADGCDVLITLVVNAEQTEQVLFGADGAAARLAKGAVVVSSATMAAGAAKRLAERLAALGILMLDAPVSGGAARARTGELSVMASGPDEAFEKAEPVLDAIAAKVHRLGPEIGTGSTVKTVNQLLAGVHIAAAAEAMALGIRAGADPRALYEVISGAAGSSWMFQNRVPHILDGDYAPLSAVNIFVKDLGIVLDTGKALTFPLPLTAAAHQQFLAAAAAGLGREDDSAVIKVFQKLAGIELPGDASQS